MFYGGTARFYIQRLLLLNSRHFEDYRRRFLGRKDFFKANFADKDQTTTMDGPHNKFIEHSSFSQIQRHRNEADK